MQRFQNELENANHDIKTLEAWLKQCQLYIPHEIKGSSLAIAWRKYGKENKFRLLALDKLNRDAIWMPLIEHKAEIRIQSIGWLPKLVSELAKIIRTVE